jgi:hypothetical protein
MGRSTYWPHSSPRQNSTRHSLPDISMTENDNDRSSIKDPEQYEALRDEGM